MKRLWVAYRIGHTWFSPCSTLCQWLLVGVYVYALCYRGLSFPWLEVPVCHEISWTSFLRCWGVSPPFQRDWSSHQDLVAELIGRDVGSVRCLRKNRPYWHDLSDVSKLEEQHWWWHWRWWGSPHHLVCILFLRWWGHCRRLPGVV